MLLYYEFAPNSHALPLPIDSPQIEEAKMKRIMLLPNQSVRKKQGLESVFQNTSARISL
jgi:hypothetical protein